MSAIFGILALDGGPVRPEWLEGLQRVLTPLGPDHQGLWREGPAGLGCCLRHVAPAALGDAQPLRSPDGAVALVFCGWLSRREELARPLGISPALFRELPDGALCLRAYGCWGDGCLERLDGEFCLALFDRARDTMLLAQSRMAAFP